MKTSRMQQEKETKRERVTKTATKPLCYISFHISYEDDVKRHSVHDNDKPVKVPERKSVPSATRKQNTHTPSPMPSQQLQSLFKMKWKRTNKQQKNTRKKVYEVNR